LFVISIGVLAGREAELKTPGADTEEDDDDDGGRKPKDITRQQFFNEMR